VEFVATDEDLEEVLEEKWDREPKTVSAKNLEMGSEIVLAESSEGTAEEGFRDSFGGILGAKL
jgi:hypothetical protein